MGRSHIGVKHHWTYPREEFVSLGAHCETGETDLIFFFWLLLVAIFFLGFFSWPLRLGFTPWGFQGAEATGGGMSLWVKLACHGIGQQAAQCKTCGNTISKTGECNVFF